MPTGAPILLVFTVLALTALPLVASKGRKGHLARPDFNYHNEFWMASYLKNVSARYSHITHLYSIGESVKGRELWVLAVGESPKKHVLLRPEVKFIGNIHGNEAVSRELLVHFIHYLTTNYRRNATISYLLNTTRIHIMISMNPDGYYVADKKGRGDCYGAIGRNNFNNQDLNRNFPDFFVANNNPRQPETLAVMRWLEQQQFVLSASLHGGAMVVNYPYDNLPKGFNRPMYHKTKDDDVFVYLAKTYSYAHPVMNRGVRCPRDFSRFRHGIVNGASWYIVKGSMQDYNYIFCGCMELTIEVSCCKFPDESALEIEWKRNKDPMIKLYSKVHSGIKGVLLGPTGNPIKGVYVEIIGRDHPTKTTAHGEFWRLLLPGSYIMRLSVPGYAKIHHSFNLPPTTEDLQSDFIKEGQKRHPYIVSTYYDDENGVTTVKIRLQKLIKDDPSSSTSIYMSYLFFVICFLLSFVRPVCNS